MQVGVTFSPPRSRRCFGFPMRSPSRRIAPVIVGALLLMAHRVEAAPDDTAAAPATVAPVPAEAPDPATPDDDGTQPEFSPTTRNWTRDTKTRSPRSPSWKPGSIRCRCWSPTGSRASFWAATSISGSSRRRGTVLASSAIKETSTSLNTPASTAGCSWATFWPPPSTRAASRRISATPPARGPGTTRFTPAGRPASSPTRST